MYTAQQSQDGPAVKGEDAPLCGLPGAGGWRSRMGQETETKRKTEGEKRRMRCRGREAEFVSEL